MDTILPPEQLRDICERSACSVTRQTSGILLELGERPPQEDVCTVYTSFERGASFALTLSADGRFFRRMSQHSVLREQVSLQDIEDSAVEYFNVLCGGVAVALYRGTKTAVRFKIPEFHYGPFVPEGREEEWALELRGDRGERVRLACYSEEHWEKQERDERRMAKKIMVVDDSRIMELQLEVLLEDSDYEIVAYCRDGEEALACYNEVQPDLVTMDILMPGMDGLETAQAIMEEHPDARIIMLSSLAYEESFREAEAIGAKMFVPKPFDREKILAAFEKALED